MTDRLSWAPSEIDPTVPSIARVYDYVLGGGHNFEADRQLARYMEENLPGVHDMARLNRSFLRRAVRFMVDSGVRQFLDIGSGIPTVGNVHEIAQGIDPACRVVYVDKEPIATTHAKALLRENDRADAFQADVRAPDDLLGRPEIARLLDFDEPIGLLNLLLWHLVPDADDPLSLCARYRDVLAPGSFLAISHATMDSDSDALRTSMDNYQRSVRTTVFFRNKQEIREFFDGFELVEPGVVNFAAWRPEGPGDFSDNALANAVCYVGVGRKP
ncbi:SAM-dependent methyltransferase [Amycolatopsis anabasis]|uniref:SAM-dependent methyltransferase n=1 Tax=Amycolatopsis anabasis TaxID=1840409 RepID=UPI00131DA251|nr:SAM-dependent methyltransferase [Amycolatopsis anabasis]